MLLRLKLEMHERLSIRSCTATAYEVARNL